MARVAFRLWVVGTLVWSAYLWMMLPHGPGMESAFAFAIGVPALGVLAFGAGIGWAFRTDRCDISVTEILRR